LGTVGLPLTNGFVGEFLLLSSVFQYSAYHYLNLALVIAAGLTIIFGAVYMLRMYKNVMQGELNELTTTFKDISGSEQLVLTVICILIIVIGVYPQPIMHISEAAVTNLLSTLNGKLVY
jgi:NADH-quinone oxidoreductase subunit M